MLTLRVNHVVLDHRNPVVDMPWSKVGSKAAVVVGSSAATGKLSTIGSADADFTLYRSHVVVEVVVTGSGTVIITSRGLQARGKSRQKTGRSH